MHSKEAYEIKGHNNLYKKKIELLLLEKIKTSKKAIVVRP